MKKLLTLLLTVSLLFSFSYIDTKACTDVTKEDISLFLERIEAIYSQGYKEGTMTLSSIKDVAVLCGLSAATDNGVICIFELTNDEGYVVTLGGTEITNKSENAGLKEDILSAFNKSNTYKKSTINAIINNIPKGENIYIYGYSLGGMVMQQVLSERQIRYSYNIKAAVAIGSPITAINRQKIVIVEDSNDVIPYLSSKSLLAGKLFRRYDTHIVRNGGYKTTIGAHALSYVDSQIWDDIDVFGTTNGYTLEINMTNFKTFYA